MKQFHIFLKQQIRMERRFFEYSSLRGIDIINTVVYIGSKLVVMP